MIGFQDTVCDDKGRRFCKDCYIEGTVDFIFGNAKSISVNGVGVLGSFKESMKNQSRLMHNAINPR
ncbi:hypothetical protein RJ639_016531 [Escallonia herrerae]|uniref:Pectinesterase n=1 Tax=Escallonia herrerae TaxID=1293975 RepID=A0AA89AIP1_9ASTE|nr:hypothetical protein RJ639_016531 [Escallonia herrerae]